MKEIDKAGLQQALDKTKPIIRERNSQTTRISEPYICLLQALTVGRYNYEILPSPTNVFTYVQRLKDAGVDISFDLTPLQRRILSVIEKGIKDRDEIIKETGIDMTRSALQKHLGGIRRSGIPLKGRVKYWRELK